MKPDIKQVISNMTLEEKAGMCSGKDFWHTKSIERLGIPSSMVSDGPYGLRKIEEHQTEGFGEAIKAVCFPAGCLTACSFDESLLQKEGEILGDECQAANISVILGPAVNIKRSPLCGRNFEYISEDPYLAGKLAAAYIKGVQSKNVGTSIKHFAANNQEYRRFYSSSNVDERTLREIYLLPFETAIKEAHPKTVMCSYNKINGTFSSENKWLLTKVLKKEWKFKGYVMSDWGAVNDRVKGLKAGLDLEMPGGNESTTKDIIEAVKNGSLKEDVLDKAIERILKVVFSFTENRIPGNFNLSEHHKISAQIAQESFVLLKNDNDILPLNKNDCDTILFIGEFAEHPRFEGGGSSHINSQTITSALDEAKARNLPIKYVKGFKTDDPDATCILIEEAVKAAASAKTVVIFAGLPDSFESEGFDRTHMHLPADQEELIKKVLEVQKNTIVVLHNGSPVEMPWVNSVKAILECYLGGDAVGTAQINVLFGDVNPSGKLAESFPILLEDNPSCLNFPGDGEKTEYKECVFVGYRYYDFKAKEVLFPFGYGLSYTTFKYTAISLNKMYMKDTETLEVSVTIINTGDRSGKEIIQLYVKDQTNSTIRPDKELKGFKKVFLNPGEAKTVTFTLDKRSFAWYNTDIHDWYAASGKYQILVGSSSRDINLCAEVFLTSTAKIPFTIDMTTLMEDILKNPIAKEAAMPFLKKYSKQLGGIEKNNKTEEEFVKEIEHSPFVQSTPIRTLRSFCNVSSEELQNFITKVNSALEQN